MEDIQTLKDIIHPRDYMVKLDLKDAYFSVPVADNDRKYLRFKWAGECMRTHAFPFGLTSAPWIFTKLFRPVLVYLRQWAVRCLMYLDDKLLLGNSPEEVKEHFNLCQKQLEENCPGTNTDNRISGVYHHLDRDDTISLPAS